MTDEGRMLPQLKKWLGNYNKQRLVDGTTPGASINWDLCSIQNPNSNSPFPVPQ